MSRRAREILLLLILGTLYTGLAAIKPVHIDEAANVYYARQISKQPLDPYGFTMFWYEEPQPANQVLTPPLLVYWEGLAVKLFGERPVLWKLWLLPFVLVFVICLYALLCRFAPGSEMALTWLTVLSPAFLPSLNLMPDIPALALSLLAVVVFLRGETAASQDCDRKSEPGALARGSLPPLADAPGSERNAIAWSLLAGLIAGIGMQTKYTGFVTPGVLLLRALLTRRYFFGLLAAGIAGTVFVGWEALVAWEYGDSHFWFQVRQSGESLFLKGSLILSLPSILGGVASGLGLLGLLALGSRRWMVIGGAAGIVLALIILACVGAAWKLEVSWPTWLGGDGETHPQWLTLASVVWGVVGILPLVAGSRLARRCWDGSGDGAFLISWLGLELIGYIILSPFPAVRRVLGIIIVSTLLVGRTIARSPPPRPRSRYKGGESGPLPRSGDGGSKCSPLSPVPRGEGRFFPPLPLDSRGEGLEVRGRLLDRPSWHALMMANMALGLLFFVVDVCDARAEMLGARAAARAIADAGGGRVWYVGHWGFQYYAEQAGMTPIVPEESVLRPGDWLVMPGDPVVRQDIGSPDDHSEVVVAIRVPEGLPWRTVVGYYGGSDPLDHCGAARLVITVRQIRAKWIPAP